MIDLAGPLAEWGLSGWKPLASALLMPPVPLLLLAVLGLWGRRRRPGAAWATIALWLGLAGTWLSQCEATADALQKARLPPAAALSAAQRQAMRPAAARGEVAVVVLGMGLDADVPEYDGALDLPPEAMQRWRYGIWLAREIGAPLVFAGGLGHLSRHPGNVTEAAAARAASLRLGLPPPDLADDRSRDTAENARNVLQRLRTHPGSAATARLVIVTHFWHMPRAMRAFERAMAAQDRRWTLVAAPMGMAPSGVPPWKRWLPSPEGHRAVLSLVRERIGWWLGA